MSDSENLRVLEETYAAFGRGDIPSLLTHLTDDVEFDTASATHIAPWHGKRRGLAGVADFFAKLGGAVEFLEFSPVSMNATEDEGVVVVHERWRALESGMESEDTIYHHFRFRDGKICAFRGSEDTFQTYSVLPRNGITWVAPILDGQVDNWRSFAAELNGTRRDQHRAAMERWGMRHEVASLMETPMGSVVCMFHESSDLPAMFQAMATSNEPHDVWFREKVMEIHGLTAEQLGQVPPSEKVTDLMAAGSGLRRTQPA